MGTGKKTREQLLHEIKELRRKISELEKSESQSRQEQIKWKESEERFRSLSKASFEGIVLHKKGKILDANETFAQMFGYDLKEIIGMNVVELAAPEWRDVVKENVLSGREEPYEAEGMRKDGSIFPGELHGKQIKYKDREVRITAVRDLTAQKKAEQALKESEEKYSLVVENSNDAIIIHRDGIIQFANSMSSRYTGVHHHELIGKPMTDYVHPDYKKKVLDNFSKRKAGEEVENIYEIAIVRKDGSFFPAEINVSLVQYQGEPAGLVFIRDITQRKKTEDAILESEGKFRDIFETAGEGILYSTLEGKVVEVNSKAEEILSIPQKEIVGRHAMALAHKFLSFKNVKKVGPIVQKVLKGKYVGSFELDYDSKVLGVNPAFNPKSKRIILIITDITSQKKAEEKIKKSLEEKEVLLKEIHHRVKNNMQVISSLINIQARRIEDEKAREVFKDTRNRVMSMALVHERLYRSEDLAGIDFKIYIERMSVHLMSYYRDVSQNIELKTDVEGILLDITKAVPLGLITNELLTNSLKHAFPKSKKGKITIDFHKKGKTYHLNIGDNGRGFPKELDFRKAESMGMDLVNSLTKQINGRIELVRDKGTLFKITFKE